MPDNDAGLAIGELARRVGTAPSALRYYERTGLLAPAERAGSKRHYPPSSAERLASVRRYQDAGFTLRTQDRRARRARHLLACPNFRAAPQTRLKAGPQAVR